MNSANRLPIPVYIKIVNNVLIFNSIILVVLIPTMLYYYFFTTFNERIYGKAFELFDIIIIAGLTWLFVFILKLVLGLISRSLMMGRILFWACVLSWLMTLFWLYMCMTMCAVPDCV